MSKGLINVRFTYCGKNKKDAADSLSPCPCINLFIPKAPFLYLLKISENHKLFGCFQGVEKGHIGNKWINADCKNITVDA